MQVIFASPAEQELADAARYLEEQRPGYGTKFIDEVESTLAYISKHPLIGMQVSGNIRKMLINRFHYSLRYRVQEDASVIQILRISHSAQDIPSDRENR